MGEGVPAGSGARAAVARSRAVLAAILLLAAVVRTIRWHQTGAIFNDGPVFLAVAELLREGRFAEALGHPFHPLYSALVALVHGVVPDLETAALVVSIGAGTAAVACLHALVRRAFDPTTALVAAFFLAVHPGAIEYSGDIQSEPLYLALFLACAAALWQGLTTRRAAPLLLAGVLGGAAYLTRPEGLGIVLVAGAGLGWAALCKRLAWGQAVALGSALALGLVLTAGPYLGWLRIDGGSFEVSGKKQLGVVAGVVEEPFQGEDPLAANPQQPWVRDADDPAPDSPQARPPRPEPSTWERALDAVLDTFQTHFRSLRYELALIGLAGLVLARPRPGRRAAMVLSVVAAYAALLLLLRFNVGYVSGRHTLPSVTLVFGYVAAAALVVTARGSLGARGRGVVLAVLLAIVAGVGLTKALKPSRLEAVAERRAASWLAQAEPDAVVAARKRRTAYYADAPWVKLATAAYPGGLRALGATHLILADDDVGDYAKLGPLEPPRMRLLHQEQAHGVTASVYGLWPEGESQ